MIKTRCVNCGSTGFIEYWDFAYWPRIALWMSIVCIIIAVEFTIHGLVDFIKPEGFNANLELGVVFSGFGICYLAVQRILKYSIVEKSGNHRIAALVMSILFAIIYAAGSALALLSPMVILIGFPISLIGVIAIGVSWINWFFWPKKIGV